MKRWTAKLIPTDVIKVSIYSFITALGFSDWFTAIPVWSYSGSLADTLLSLYDHTQVLWLTLWPYSGYLTDSLLSMYDRTQVLWLTHCYSCMTVLRFSGWLTAIHVWLYSGSLADSLLYMYDCTQVIWLTHCYPCMTVLRFSGWLTAIPVWPYSGSLADSLTAVLPTSFGKSLLPGALHRRSKFANFCYALM